MKSLRLAALSIAAFLAMGVSAFADTQRITESTVMYDGPGTNYAVVGELATNTKVQVSTCQNGFCKVRHFWDEGWVIQDYLRAAAPAAIPGLPGPGPTAAVPGLSAASVSGPAAAVPGLSAAAAPGLRGRWRLLLQRAQLRWCRAVP